MILAPADSRLRRHRFSAASQSQVRSVAQDIKRMAIVCHSTRELS